MNGDAPRGSPSWSNKKASWGEPVWGLSPPGGEPTPFASLVLQAEAPKTAHSYTWRTGSGAPPLPSLPRATMAGRGVMDAAKELQSLVDDNKHKITEEGFYLELSNAAMKVHERAAALDETSDASEEEEEEGEEAEDDEEDDWYWEDGLQDSETIASWMIDVVKFDDPDYFVNLVDGLDVCNPMHTRKPRARAMVIAQLLKELDPNNRHDVANVRKWKQDVLSWNGLRRFAYILKQHWLDDYHGMDADPRYHIVEIVELLGDIDDAFRQLMRLRGIYRALNELVDHSRVNHLRSVAYRLLEKVGELVTN